MCKEKYCIDLDLKDYEVVVYWNKFIFLLELVVCERYIVYGYKMFCKLCEILLCVYFRYVQYEIIDIFIVFELKRKFYKKIINNIRSDVFYYSYFLLVNIRIDIKFC